jgi:hypothetical protein
MTQKSFNLIKDEKNTKKCSMIKYMFTDGQFNLVLSEMDFGSLIEPIDSKKKFKQNNKFSITWFSLLE